MTRRRVTAVMLSPSSVFMHPARVATVAYTRPGCRDAIYRVCALLRNIFPFCVLYVDCNHHVYAMG